MRKADLNNWATIIEKLERKDISDRKLKMSIDQVLTPKLKE